MRSVSGLSCLSLLENALEALQVLCMYYVSNSAEPGKV
jgi:hypothetical protein